MTACVIDADVLIAALDRRDANHAAAARLVTRLAAAQTDLLISSVNYAETLVRPSGHPEAARAAAAAIRTIGVKVVAPGESIARAAAGHRATGSIGLPDAFAVATAEQRRAALASNDRSVRRYARGLGIEIL